jgi:hypothetical protein
MLEVEVSDLVSEAESMDVYYQVQGTDAWQRLEPPHSIDLSGFGDDDVVIEIEAVDEAGNVTYGEYAIRGRPPGTDPSDCGSCALTGEGGTLPLAGLVLVLLVLAVLRPGAWRRGGGR